MAGRCAVGGLEGGLEGWGKEVQLISSADTTFPHLAVR